MNPDTLVVVSAYAGDIHQVENNLPVYLHHECPVLILSPSNAPITKVAGGNHQVHCQWVGESGWAGPQTLVRHRLFLEKMLEFPHRWFLMNDADSACLSKIIPEYLYLEQAAWSNEVPDLNPGKSYLPKKACQPPYFFHRYVLAAMHRVAASGQIPTSYYGEITGDPVVTECIDHYHMQLAHGSSYPLKSFPDGASFETASEHGLSTMLHHVRLGKRMIHQIKTKRVLDALLAAI